VIELSKEFHESDLNQHLQLLHKENKDLKSTLNAYSNEINLMNKHGKLLNLNFFKVATKFQKL
jgi:hypothetical protein